MLEFYWRDNYNRYMPIKVDLTGHKTESIEVLSFSHMSQGNSYWNCRCLLCDKNTITSASNLKKNKSCGCRQGWWRSTKPGLWKDKAAYSRWQRENPVRKLRNSVSNSIRVMIKKNGSYKRKKSIRNYLPYTIEELKSHLESLWEPWMNWDNYGGRSNDPRKTWHIDHIKPHQSFNYKTMNDPLFLECWSLKNLRPLEKKENISKGGKPIAHK